MMHHYKSLIIEIPRSHVSLGMTRTRDEAYSFSCAVNPGLDWELTKRPEAIDRTSRLTYLNTNSTHFHILFYNGLRGIFDRYARQG